MKHPKRILILLGSVATLLLIATVVLSILLIRRSTPEEPSVHGFLCRWGESEKR